MRLGSMFCRHCETWHPSSQPCECEGAKAERWKPYEDALARAKAAPSRSDKTATLAIGEPLAPFDPPTVIVGMPDTAWLELEQGHAMTFDLQHAGIRAQLIIFRARDGAHVAELLAASQEMIDGSPDVGTQDPTKQ